MIRILYGERGSGKTERLINMANAEMKEAKGHVVFISRDNRYMLNIHHSIRYVDASEYRASKPQKFIGFLLGLLAGNFDIEKVFLMGFPRLGGFEQAGNMQELLAEMETVSQKYNVQFILGVRGDRDAQPEFMKPYLID
ncbi:MAG: hypothetical protein PHO66_01415 [Eubacteriales bacterium]|nr:hypothetical protein [Eubacteriales bacterium]